MSRSRTLVRQFRLSPRPGSSGAVRIKKWIELKDWTPYPASSFHRMFVGIAGSGNLCPAHDGDWQCGRQRGHTGRHVTVGTFGWLRVWWWE